MPPKRKKTIKSTRVKKRKVTKPKRFIKLEVKEEITNSSIDSPICGLCNGVFENDNSLNARVKGCKCQQLLSKLGAKRTLKCLKCPKLFKFEKSYIRHCLNEHSKTPGSVSCAQCQVSCPNKNVLLKHIKSTHSKEFMCPKCSRKFVRHAHVLRHLAQSGCDGSPTSSYPCEICDSTFSRKDNLMVHLRFQHILNNSYPCKDTSCSYQTKNFSKLIKHWLYTHNDPLKFECDICGKLTSSRTSMAKHLEIHGEKKFVCIKCGYSTFTAEVLKRHLLTHVQDKPHKCEICGQSYIQRLQLKRHLERHVSNTCSTCGRKFNTKARLVIHERTHLGLNRLVCPFDTCSSTKEFSSELNLHTHVQAHINEKKFPCEVCGKQYFSEVNMRRHLSTHRLDKPRRCMYCVTARAYIRGEQLLRHVRQHHPDMFATHLAHVRQVMGTNIAIDRVKKSELESILTLLDAESERILDGYSGLDVLYGGMQEDSSSQTTVTTTTDVPIKYEPSPLMGEEELEDNLKKLLSQLIDQDTLECFGWPDESIDSVLEKVIVQCGARAADRSRWTRVQCLRENTKHLFLYAVEDKHIARMLDTHTIDQIVLHILAQVADE